MAKQATAAAAAAETTKVRTYVLKNQNWESIKAPEFGGQSDVIELNEEEVAGPFVYLGFTTITTELGDSASHTASMEDGKTLRLPLHATFQKAIDQASLKQGDTFYMKRFPDVVKKKGKGAGNMMQIYGIKVTERAPEAANG